MSQGIPTVGRSSRGGHISGISTRQNQQSSLQMLAAQRHRYSVAKRWYLGRVWVPAAFAVAAPVVRFGAPEVTQYLAAAAGLWIFTARIWFKRREVANIRRAAAIQDRFDRHVFALPEGHIEHPLHEEIAADAARCRDCEGMVDWYPDIQGSDPLTAAMLAQRANLAWSSGLHGRMTSYLRGLATLIFAGFVLGGALADLSLVDFLVSFGLPVLPALVVVVEEAEAHHAAREQRSSRARSIEQALHAGEVLTPADAAAVQEQLHQDRVSAPLAPDWIYRRHREQDEKRMRDTARTLGA